MIDLQIKKELFWDTDIRILDKNKNKRLIIERVLSYGNLSELKEIMKYYGKEVIIQEIKKTGYLDPKTLEFVVTYFGVSKEELTCYIKKQSAPQHWN
jgi:hypothetical protein